MGNPENLAAPRPGIKILLVDDEPDTLAYLTSFFEDNGYTTISASNGQQAVVKARAEKPQLITLDITMPEQSGVKTLTELQGDPSTSAIPVVIVTGVAHDFKKFIHSRRQVKTPAGYLEKPVDRQEMLALVKKILS
jgi:CheY-like chemotaxis protein